MKVTRRQLLRIIRENLEIENYSLKEGKEVIAVKTNLVNEIHDYIDKSNIDSDSKEDAKNVVSLISSATEEKLAKIINSKASKSLIKLIGAGSWATGATFLSAFIFASGLFFTLPSMINKSINALNTVPGKLRNFSSTKGSPVEIGDLSQEKIKSIASEVTSSFGISQMSRDELVDFLAIGIALENKEGNNNPLEALRKEKVISEDFYKHVLKRFYKMREDKSINNIKNDILEKIKAKLENNPGDQELTLKAIIDIGTAVTV